MTTGVVLIGVGAAAVASWLLTEWQGGRLGAPATKSDWAALMGASALIILGSYAIGARP